MSRFPGSTRWTTIVRPSTRLHYQTCRAVTSALGASLGGIGATGPCCRSSRGALRSSDETGAKECGPRSRGGLEVRKSSFGFWLAGAPIIVLIACSGDSGSTGSAGVLSRRGESCQTRKDCEAGLACVNQVCAVDHFAVPLSPKECAMVQCLQSSDCCPIAFSSTCQQLKAECDNGSSVACDQFNSQCVCATECLAGECIQHCSPTEYCDGGKRCNGATCVACLCDADCGFGQTCRGGRCWESCGADLDCAPMHRCQDGACVESGCTADRECIAALKDVLAVCREAVCAVTCNTDLECDSPTNFGFSACIDGLCKDLGCQSKSTTYRRASRCTPRPSSIHRRPRTYR
jgi:hypothetical protein